MAYYYNIYDLCLKSNFQMNNLQSIPQQEVVDVTFTKKNIQSEIKRLQRYVQQNAIAFHEGEVLLLIQEIGQFWIKNKREVFFQLEPNCSIEKALPHLYSTVMTILLQQRNLFPIHASAVVHQGKVQLFSGHSGMGKSTLAAQLNAKGFPLFSDDKCVLYWNDDHQQVYVKSAISTVRLCADAIEQLDALPWLNNGKPVTYKDDKTEFDVSAWMIKEDMPVGSLYVLRKRPTERVFSRMLKGARKMAVIQEQAFKQAFIAGLNKQDVHFAFLQRLFTQLPVTALVRPMNLPSWKFANFVEIVLKQHG